MLAGKASSDPLRLQRFFQEARFLANLAHPNVLPVFALEEAQGWMVMELMSGSMKDRINSRAVSVDVTRSVLAQAFEALNYIHGLGRVHASIRPSNILISDTGMVKLSDFSDRRTEDGLDAPAPNLSKYVPPEIWDHSQFGPIGPTLDFYSLGITLIECVTGKPLEQLAKGFNRQNSPEVEWARWHTSPDHAKGISDIINTSVPRQLRPLLEAMLKQKAKDRPQSATQLTALLGSTKLIAVDIPVENAATQSTVSPATPASPFPTVAGFPSSQSDPSPQRSATDTGRKASADSPAKWNAKANSTKRIDLNNPKTFRIVAAITLGLAGIFGLLLQSIISPSIPPTPLSVEVQPVEASVSLNGKPVKLESGKGELELPPNEYVIKVAMEGYDTVEETLKIENPEEGKKVTKVERTFKLLESERTLPLLIDPSDADVLVDGKKPKLSADKQNGQSQIVLRPGSYEFSLSREGHVSRTVTQEVDRSTKQLQFEPLLIQFEVSVSPTEAIIDLSDAQPFEGSKNIFAVKPGKHQLKVTQAGFEPSSQEIEVSGEKRKVEVTLVPSLVQFEVKLPDPSIQIRVDGQLLTPDSKGKYALKPGEYKLAFQMGELKGEQPSQETWDQQVKVELGMLPVVIEIPESIAKMMGNKPETGSPVSNNSKLKSIVIRVFPTNSSNLKVILNDDPIELKEGEASIEYAALKGEGKAIEFKVLRNNRTEFEDFITRESLESQGEIAVINHSFPLSEKEHARRLWIFARPMVKSLPEQAIEKLDEAIKLDPNLAVAYRERAIAKDRLNLVAEAEEDVLKALAVMPDDYASLSIGGVVASKMFLESNGASEQANFSLALTRLNKAVDRFPKRTWARVMRAQLHYWSGNNQSAESDLVALLTLTQEPGQVSYVKSQLGTIAAKAGNVKLALQLFDEAIEIKIKAELSTTVPQFNKAKTILEFARQVQQEDPGKARQYYEIAKKELVLLDGRADLEPNDMPKILAMLAEIEAMLGNYQAAIRFYTNLIDKGVVTPIILRNRAAAYEAIGDTKAAEEDKAKAEQLQKR
jgi:serine/threonine protein kinase/tetratricopeptide (TPR) repeat protein